MAIRISPNSSATDGRFAVAQDTLPAFLLFRFQQPAEFQKRALRILDQAGQSVLKIDPIALRPITFSHDFGGF